MQQYTDAALAAPHQNPALAGLLFQRAMEQEACRRGGGDLKCPVQRVTDFLEVMFVAVCCSVQYVAVCCVAVCCVAVSCSVLQCVAVCCSVQEKWRRLEVSRVT